MSNKEDRLASVRRRIKILREMLEDPATLSSVSIDGVAETFNRADARAELKELEEEEARLTGATRRIYRIRFER